MISVEDEVINKSGKTVEITNFSYLRRKNYRPANKFFILHEGPLGVFNDTLKEVTYDEIEEENEIVEVTKNGWIGFTDHYWQVAIFPENDKPFKARFKNLENNPNSVQIDFINESIQSLPNDGRMKIKSYVFAGAKEVPLIDKYIQELKINKLDLSVDFGWFYFLTKPLFYALHFLSGLSGNFGIGIIILTICIRVLLFPLANKSFKSMNAMRILTPEIQRLRERYKDDKAKMNQEMFAMYKEKKINPASGCLPILIQIPIFFALYKVLFVSIEMRHAPFFGWIKDLSAPDPTSLFNLFGLIPWDPPMFLTIGIWPILMGLTMYLQQKINPPPPDPIQAKIFMMLPFIFTFLLATFPSGMVVYWTINNILSIAQQYFLLKKQKADNPVS
jgi:YidC/Oxa1 family membrane protein insertase